jgi:hypothetical protein
MSEREVEIEGESYDLVANRAYMPALKRLFSGPGGTWHPLRDLLGKSTVGETMVTWLVHPLGEPGFCMVIFHEMESGWTGSAYVNVELVNRTDSAT